MSGPTPDTLDEAAIATARARLYGLLAATFDGEAETIAAALEGEAFAAVAEAFPIDIATANLRGDGHDAESLKIGYDNLFVVPGRHYVPPFASAHAVDPSEEFESDSRYHTAGEAGELLGDPAADMAQLYAAAGFSPERGDDIPDHVAASFEFMRALCEREAALLEGDGREGSLDAVRDLQARTLSRLGWIDRFEDAVADRDTVEGVFAAIARLARTFTAWDAQEVVDADDRPSETTPA
ncbi:TorD/DmsD family molecular chaperone [Halorubrum persicum]|uniref:TorD/DmsD family molecular chaperone n=1 Tax=Halorubrum persicum TaxID=1383844 RepID=UPI0015D4EE57|nr:molecular chaperone TorD family protein [Halorubrum persicum]